MEKDKKSAIIDKMDSFMKKRAWLQKLGFRSAGSIFKNPQDTHPAGRLIELCGLKGYRIGGAEISRSHANIIINTGGASCRDVLGLIDVERGKVKDKFGIDLELELKVL